MGSPESPSFRCTPRKTAFLIELSVLLLITTIACSTGMAQSQANSPSQTQRPAEVRLSVEPGTTTLEPAARRQFTAFVEGTSNTAVRWSASEGWVSRSGLFFAPAIHRTTLITVTATSAADPRIHASSLVTVQPAPPLAITTSSLTGAVVNRAYDANLSASGGNPPYRWTISAGSLAAGIQLQASTGALAGTALQPGNYSFTAKVTDGASNSVTQNFTLAVSTVTNSNFDGPAELPRVYMQTALADTPAPGSTITVNAGGNLQAALNSASCGDTIALPAGATFSVGQITLPAKACDDQHWIVIRTIAPDASLPPEGTRMTPCYAGVASLPGRPPLDCASTQKVLATIVYSGVGDGPFIIASGANHYRLLGLEITRAVGTELVGALIASKGYAADHIVIDRSWLHGVAVDDTSVGFGVNGLTNAAVVDSYFTDFHCASVVGKCLEGHAVSGGLGSLPGGPYKIVDNFLEASGENILFGGGPATTAPADIEVRGNHFFKPLIWQQGRPGYVGGVDGHPFTVKNHFELKNAQRVLFEGNILENNWGGFTQQGHSILLCPKNQHTDTGDVCPLCQVTDVTIRYSTISHVGGGVKMGTSISGNGTDGGMALAGARWTIHDVTIDDVNASAYAGDGNLLMIASGWTRNVLNNVMINHVTGFTDPTGTLLFAANNVSYPRISNITITNNIFATGLYPVWNLAGGSTSCAYSDIPITVVNLCFSAHLVSHNALMESPTNFPPSRWPAGNYFPASADAVGFVNYNNGNGGNYALLPSSPFKNAGSDGNDLGADISAIEAAISSAR